MNILHPSISSSKVDLTWFIVVTMFPTSPTIVAKTTRPEEKMNSRVEDEGFHTEKSIENLEDELEGVRRPWLTKKRFRQRNDRVV